MESNCFRWQITVIWCFFSGFSFWFESYVDSVSALLERNDLSNGVDSVGWNVLYLPSHLAIELAHGPTASQTGKSDFRLSAFHQLYRNLAPQMFDTICTFPLSSELFAQAIHPSEPLFSVGLSNGYVKTLKLPPVEDGGQEPPQKKRRGSNGTGVVDTAWETKRHKGSCRCVAYSIDGRSLYSAGTDGIVKAAETGSGRVIGKLAIPAHRSSSVKDEVDAPTIVHALSPQTFLLATDSGALHLYDLRDPAPSVSTATAPGGKQAFTGARPAQTHHPHTDFVSSLTALPPSNSSTSGYSKQWLTTGGTTLALTDLRRGVLVKSEDQEDILLSSLYVTGLTAKKSSGSTGEKALIGGSDGVITLWEKGQWDDQDERIVVSRENETVDALALVPDGAGGFGKKIVAGLGDGKIRFIRLGENKIVDELQHDEVEGVISLGFDVDGRMISSGGLVVKVWEEHVAEAKADEESDSGGDNDSAGENDIEAADENGGAGNASSEDDEGERRKPRKKRRKGRGPASTPTLSFAGLD